MIPGLPTAEVPFRNVLLRLDNTFCVREGDLRTPWRELAKNVESFSHVADTLFVLKRDGTFLAKAGSVSAEGIKMASQARTFSIQTVT